MLLGTLLWLSAPVSAAAQGAGGVRGQIRSDSNGATLPGAVVEILHPGGPSATIADARGQYRLEGIPAGRHVLRVRHIGHAPLELEVVIAPTAEIVVDLALSARPIPLEPIAVNTDPLRTGADSLSAQAPDLALASTRAIEASPGLAEVGIADAVRGLPGKEPSDPGSVLYIRGAAADLKLVYLDGAPVYAPFPLGGLLDPFAPEVLNSADIYLGGAPARYDGGLSYVMDLRTRGHGAQGVQLSGSADMISARAMAEASLGDRLGLVASARGMHPFASAALLGERLPYSYQEGLLRSDVRLTESLRLSATGFSNRESVRMGEPEAMDSVIRWGNTAGSIRLGGALGATNFELTAAVGDYEASLPLAASRPLVADATARRTRYSVDFVRAGRLGIRYGASLDRQAYRAAAISPETVATTAIVQSEGAATGVYAEATGQVGPRLSLRGGGRADHFSSTGDITLAPRFAATWLVTERAAMTFAGGVYHQFLRPPDEVLLADPETAGAISPPLAVARASHLTVALDQDLGEEVSLGIEGFYKNFANLPGALTMEANASGVDFWVSRGAGAWTGWVGYSLAWVWSGATSEGRTDFSGRHLLSTGVTTRIGSGTSIDLRFAYGAGLPYAGIPIAPDRNGDGMVRAMPTLSSAERGGTESAPLLYTPEKPYLRLDAAISQQWRPRWGGGTLALEPYLKLLNGLGRRDALFYVLDEGRDASPRAIADLPILPVIGVNVEF